MKEKPKGEELHIKLYKKQLVRAVFLF